jgi:hypothetical protein
VIFKPPQDYKLAECSGYRFHIPKTFQQRFGEDSTLFKCKEDEGLQLYVQVCEPKPVEYLSKLSDEQKEIAEIAEKKAK